MNKPANDENAHDASPLEPGAPADDSSVHPDEVKRAELYAAARELEAATHIPQLGRFAAAIAAMVELPAEAEARTKPAKPTPKAKGKR